MPKPLIHAHYKGWASMDPEGIYGLKAWRGRRGAEQCQRYLEMTRSRPEQQIQRAVFQHLALAQLEAWDLLRDSCQGRRP
jgi:hypothetical protein